MRDLIINSPSLQTLRQRYSSVLITLVFWVIWFFLWIPIITAVAWYLGFDVMYFEMFEMSGYKEVIRSFINFLIVVAILGGSLAVWATYNYLRFRGKDRRSAIKVVTPADISNYLNVDEDELKKYQHDRFVSVDFDDEGNFAHFQQGIRPPPSTSDSPDSNTAR